MLVYDNASRLTKANSGRYNNLVTRAYDAGGRMTSEALTVNGQTYPVASGYDAANRRTLITYPNGKIVAQTFTNRDQLSNVKYDAVNVATFAYDLGGRKTTNTFGNSKVETRTYRADNRTNTIVTPTGITNFAYAWDVNKNKTQENDTALPTNVQDYTYDNEDRLTGFARNSGQTQAWTLSLVGDWSAFNDNGSAQTRTHNAVHELTGVNANPLTYDAKGNLTANSNGQTHTWDFENCMKTAVVGADTATYTYDAFRRRVTKNFQGTTTVFVYDGWRSISEYENGAALTAPARVYVFGTYLDEPLMMLVGSTKYYYHANDLYSVAALTNSAGTVVERYKYDPYGKVTVLDAAGTAKADPNNSEYGNPFTYTGQRLDKETGLMYYKNRYYSVDLGRFVSRDPIGYWAGMHLFRYVCNRPASLLDPMGYSEFSVDYYKKVIEGLLKRGKPTLDELWREVLTTYFNADEKSTLWDCEDDMEEIFEAFYKTIGESHTQGVNVYPGDDGSFVAHFFGGAAHQATWNGGVMAQRGLEMLQEFDTSGFSKGIYNTGWGSYTASDSWSDDAFGFAGAYFAEKFDTWCEDPCVCFVKLFVKGTYKLTDLLPKNPPNKKAGWAGREKWVNEFKKNVDAVLEKNCK